MLLLKTDKARQELAPGMRTLSLRERSLLLLAEGKPLAELQAMYSGGGAEIVEHLLSQGYLSLSAPALQDTLLTPPAHTQPSALRPEAVTPPEPSDHLRSLAGARMYLFDICERLFARRDPDLARFYHAALREPRDRHSMREVGEALIAEVSKVAGDERAQGIRERLKQLQPPERALSAAMSD